MADYRLGSLLWSIGLIVGGVLLLLFNFDQFTAYEPWAQYALTGVLALSGIGFLGAFLSARQHWWRLIPGWTLLALAAMVYLSTLPTVRVQLSAAILFVGLALAFAHVYLLDRAERWWSIIPSGFMLVLGLVVGISSVVTDLELLGTFLFVGLGLVFFVLYALGGRRRQWWAIIPGGVLTLFGLFVFARENDSQNTLLRWWPLLLVLIGIGFAVQALRRPPSQPLVVNQAPALRPLPRPLPVPDKAKANPSALIDYTRPAPGASVEILPDRDE